MRRRLWPLGVLILLSACTAAAEETPTITVTRTVPAPPMIETPTAGPQPSASDSDDEQGDDEDGDERRKPENAVGVEVDAQPPDTAPTDERVTCPSQGRTVSTADALKVALRNARPGTVIKLADGRYTGLFETTASGTADRPIWLCGSPNAVLAGEGIKSGYVFHLDGAQHWRLVGFTVVDGQKGVMADGTTGTVIQGLTVHTIGDEGIHLRRHSVGNRVIANRIHDTGLRRDKFGEGVYIGSAISNWCSLTDCQPDRSDRNIISANVIGPTTSEGIDVKEGTTRGILAGNRIDGSGTTAADSLVDVKGTAWLIEGNIGLAAPLDGFQTHQIVPRWGERNLFRRNSVAGGPIPAEVAEKEDTGKRYGFAFRPVAANVVTCDNTVTGGLALANVPCRP